MIEIFNQPEEQVQEQVTQRIYVKESKLKDGREGYCWAWEESMEKKIFGWDQTLDNIKKRASNMFPGRQIALLFL